MSHSRGVADVDGALDRAIEAMRIEAIDVAAAEDAAGRVWTHLSASGRPLPLGVLLERCEDFRALLSDYIADRLRPETANLLADHLVGCAGCRQALAAARSGSAAGPRPLLRRSAAGRRTTGLRLPRRRRVAWPLAAAAVLAAGLVTLSATRWLPFGPAPALAQVSHVDGQLWRVDGAQFQPLVQGGTVRARQLLRTADGSRAVLQLADGSQVEMDGRAALSLARRPGRTTIGLQQGRLIVRAADQGRGQLALSTDDCVATVHGTLFAMDHGLVGSRVSVLSGQVQVDDERGRYLLGPGDQIVTAPGLAPMSIEEEVAWSLDAESYRQLIEGLRALRADLEAVWLPGGRTDSPLLDRVPVDADVYIAMPNPGRLLSATRAALDRRLADNAELRSWWSEAVGSSGAFDDMDEVFQPLARLGDGLGEELALAMRLPDEGSDAEVLLLASVTDTIRVRRVLDSELARLDTADGNQPPITVVTDRSELDALQGRSGAQRAAVYVWLGGSVMAASPDVRWLRVAATAELDGRATGFRSAPFGQRIAGAYARGVDWLVAADAARVLERALTGTAGSGSDQAAAARRALAGARYLVASETGAETGARTEATLSFDGPRQGMAAWLSAPAPMGSLRFISPEASAVAAAVVADPAVMLADLYELVEAQSPGAMQKLRLGSQGQVLQLIDEMASHLGGDVAVALDGPLLPQPSLVLIAEVTDPDGLSSAIDHALEVVSSSSGGVGAAHGVPPLHYAIRDGYVVIGPSEAIVERALRVRQSGSSIAEADEIKRNLPREEGLNVSALLYQNAAGLVGDLPSKLAGGPPLGNSGGSTAAETLAALAPTVATAVALPDEIRLSGDGASWLWSLPMLELLGAEPPAGP